MAKQCVKHDLLQPGADVHTQQKQRTFVCLILDVGGVLRWPLLYERNGELKRSVFVTIVWHSLCASPRYWSLISFHRDVEIVVPREVHL